MIDLVKLSLEKTDSLQPTGIKIVNFSSWWNCPSVIKLLKFEVCQINILDENVISIKDFRNFFNVFNVVA